jgi:hypothetical protein
MNISLASSGKFLPVPFARGYIIALWLPTRTETWKTYYRSAVARFVPVAEEDHWLHLLDPYLTESNAVTPLDYTILRLIHTNMLDDGRTEPRKMHQLAASLTGSIGEAWWVGTGPLSDYRDYGLQHLLTPHILAHINQDSDGKLYRQQGGEASAILATQRFVEQFARESGMAITAVVTPSQITIVIDDCPFCLQHPNCRVFAGVVNGFLDWLHKAKTISEIFPFLQWNKAASSAHHIVLDILTYPSGDLNPLPPLPDE